MKTKNKKDNSKFGMLLTICGFVALAIVSANYPQVFPMAFPIVFAMFALAGAVVLWEDATFTNEDEN